MRTIIYGFIRPALKLAIPYITKDTFPLPTLHGELRRLSHELHFGHGFFVLRGLDVDRYTREENVVIYAGLSAHIAPQRGRQDHKSPYDGVSPADVVLTHIKDLSDRPELKGSIGSPAYTTDKQVFHTDSGDIVSLFALETSLEGGASKLASTWRVYNELAAKRPDLIHTLTQPWDMEVYGFGDALFYYYSLHKQKLLADCAWLAKLGSRRIPRKSSPSGGSCSTTLLLRRRLSASACSMRGATL